MRKVCIVISSRANYGSIRSVLIAIEAEPSLQLQIVLSASALLDQYGSVESDIESLGLSVDERVHSLVEGETPETMAKSTGLALLELPSVFGRLRPDIVFVIGDRFEIIATAIAASYMNIHVAHSMGGEVTGTIDESVRHAVTKLAHLHFVATTEAAKRVLRLGERQDAIHCVGCPRIDTVREYLQEPGLFRQLSYFVRDLGVGSNIDLTKQYLVVSQHPVTTEYDDANSHMAATIEAIEMIGIQAIVLWPNADAGSTRLARELRKWRESSPNASVRFFKNFPVKLYMGLLANAGCLVGNSSSGVREGAFLGTPVVNIGTRQISRERSANVIDVENDSTQISRAVEIQIGHGRFDSNPLYGDGYSASRIVEILCGDLPPIQKRIEY